jgi:hypothetical protein
VERSYGIGSFVLEEVDGEGAVTPRAGLMSVAEAARGMGLPTVANREVKIKERERGFTSWEFMESGIALPEEFERARPKRLRFHLFSIPAQLIRHARQTIARVVGTLDELPVRLSAVRQALWQQTPTWEAAAAPCPAPCDNSGDCARPLLPLNNPLPPPRPPPQAPDDPYRTIKGVLDGLPARPGFR